MKNLFNDLIDSGAWTLLRGQTEKLIVAWFATKYPQKPLQALREESLLNIVKSIGASKQKIVKESIETILRTSTFLSCYETHQLAISVQVNGKDSGNVSRKDSRNVSSPKKEKGKEEEESFPPDPLLKKKEKREKKETLSPMCASAKDVPTQEVGRVRVKSGGGGSQSALAAAADPANATCDQRVTDYSTVVKDRDSFDRFFKIYPKRWGLNPTGYKKLCAYWVDAEKKGWSGEAILQALHSVLPHWEKLIQKGQKSTIPDASAFLEEEWMRTLLPKPYVSKLLNEPLDDASITLANPNGFAEFCEIYPNKRGLFNPEERVVVERAWKGCEERGWHAYDIIRSVQEGLCSKRWTDENGRFIPTAEKFLNEEQMRNFLPIGYDPQGKTQAATKRAKDELDDLMRYI